MRMKIIYWVALALGVALVGCGQGNLPKDTESKTETSEQVQVPQQDTSNTVSKELTKTTTVSDSKKKKSEKKKVEPIVWEYRNNRNTLYFINSEGEKIKTIDIEANNPFNDIPFPIKEVDGIYTNYDSDKITIADLEKHFGELIIDERGKYNKITYMQTGGILGGVSKSYAAVAYTLGLTTRHNYEDYYDYQDSGITKIFIYNNKGELVNTIVNKEFCANDFSMSRDGKYFVFRYGGGYDDPDGYGTPIGYVFYNTLSGKIETHFNKSGILKGLGSIGKIGDNKFCFSNRGYSGREIFIMDLAKMTLRSHLLTYGEIKEKGAPHFFSDFIVLRKNQDTIFFNNFKEIKFDR